MNKWVTAALLRIVGMLVDGKVLDEILRLVQTYFSETLSGPEKRDAVEQELRVLRGEVGEAVRETAGYLINLAIEAAVAYLKARSEQ